MLPSTSEVRSNSSEIRRSPSTSLIIRVFEGSMAHSLVSNISCPNLTDHLSDYLRVPLVIADNKSNTVVEELEGPKPLVKSLQLKPIKVGQCWSDNSVGRHSTILNLSQRKYVLSHSLGTMASPKPGGINHPIKDYHQDEQEEGYVYTTSNGVRKHCYCPMLHLCCMMH